MQHLLAVPLAIALAAPAADLAARVALLSPGGVVGLCAVHVESGRTESARAGERFAMASTVKLPLAVAVLRAADRGKVDEEAPVAVGPADVRHGIGPQLGAGTYSFRRLLAAMMQESDNTATDALFRLVGGPAGVRAALAEIGISGIDVSRTEGEIFAQWKKGAVEKETRDTATPEAMARLLVKLKRGELLSPGRTASLLAVMRGCRTGDARIRAGLPKGTEVADKTGTMDPFASDVGLVTLPDGTHLALAVYVRGGRHRDRVIAEAARATWEAFTRN